MILLNTTDEVTAFLRDYAAAECHAETLTALPRMTEAEIAAVEQAFADSPPAAVWTDADADAVFGLHDGCDGNECDPDSPDGF